MLRIGTRKSKLAIWQANQVYEQLLEKKYSATIIGIESDGDIDLVTPLYASGIQGVFTKALDIALLDNTIDVAVHSYKDVPTTLAKGLYVAAVLERGNYADVLICKNRSAVEQVRLGNNLVIATSSIRRKAQWLHRYPHSTIEHIRGNVQTRIEKLKNADWHGAVFAAAGLDRLDITEDSSGPQLVLDWMLPAPAQGAIVVVCREDDADAIAAVQSFNHAPTQQCTMVERELLRLLQGGCSTPVSALAQIVDGTMLLNANITAPDGSNSFSVTVKKPVADYASIPALAVAQFQMNGAIQYLKP